MLPLVGDAESWPTPDTVTMDNRRKSASLDKPEKPEIKLGGSKAHGKQWVQVPFVPTAVFNTPLPPSAARRGGRGGGRGRDGAGRGGGNQGNGGPVDKGESTGSMAPPPQTRQQEQERGRKADAGRGGRAASVPTQGSRNESSSAHGTELRKTTETSGKDRTVTSQGKGAQPDVTKTSKSTELADAVGVPNSAPLSQQFSDTPEAIKSQNITESEGTTADESHAHPPSDSISRINSGEWHRGAPVAGRATGEVSRDKHFNRSRDVSRDKPEMSRDTWRDRDRDREVQPEMGNRRDPRSERGRGTYRGRGSHQPFGAHPGSTHSYTAPLPQQPFSSSKSNHFNDNRHRQSSQPYPALQSLPGNRNNPRSQSIPSNNGFNQYPVGITGMVSPLSPLPTDMSVFGYGQIPSVMTTMPYHPALDSYALLSMLGSQVEYYFSVDNLCKDMFLRKNMDSQGWVPISVIANFRRIQSLTENMDTLRTVCTSLPTVEFLPGESGEEDRLRRRNDWHKFVLNLDERLPEAQNEGPQHQAAAASKAAPNGYPRFTDPYFTTTPQSRVSGWSPAMFGGPPPLSPGSQIHPTTLEEVAPEGGVTTNGMEFSPTEHAMPFTFGSFGREGEVERDQNTNGGYSDPNPIGHSSPARVFRAEGENVFPDEQISELKLVIRKTDDSSTLSQPPFGSNSTRTFSQGSIDDTQHLASPQSEQAAQLASGLRGGASSPEQ